MSAKVQFDPTGITISWLIFIYVIVYDYVRFGIDL